MSTIARAPHLIHTCWVEPAECRGHAALQHITIKTHMCLVLRVESVRNPLMMTGLQHLRTRTADSSWQRQSNLEQGYFDTKMFSVIFAWYVWGTCVDSRHHNVTEVIHCTHMYAWMALLGKHARSCRDVRKHLNTWHTHVYVRVWA